MSAQRSRFEEWKRSRKLDTTPLDRSPNKRADHYLFPEVQAQWVSWQAAETAAVRACEEAARNEHLKEPWSDSADVAYELGIDQAVKAIRSAYPEAFEGK